MRARYHHEAEHLLRADNRGMRAWGCLRCPTLPGGRHGTILLTLDFDAEDPCGPDFLRSIYPGLRVIRGRGRAWEACPFCLCDQWDEIRIEGPGR
uniref:Uncharacterized protein n=1 Tax=viral metagenome TaxID=1070528 RepID=A0A6H1ZXV4_9ZZZZ